MIRLLYSTVVLLLLPLALFRLWWKGRKQSAYRERWLERLGRVPWLQPKHRLWIHAVSVGETVAAAPLVRSWQDRHPDWAILLTTTTPTGSAQVRQLFGDSVEHCYLPFDLPWVNRQFLQRCRPTLGIIMETEIWPNLYQACSNESLPLVIANARLSDKSFRAYQRLHWLVQPTLEQVTCIATRGQEDAERFLALGAKPSAVQVLGNLKFDLQAPVHALEHGLAWRHWWGPNRPVWVAASTHPGEEEQLLRTHQTLLKVQPQALLVLAPRHPDRTAQIVQLLQSSGLKYLLRSSVNGDHPSPDQTVAKDPLHILLVDSLGELMTFYAASDLAYVGGSLVPHGGHNPLEPLTMGKPVISGREVFNFREVYAELAAIDGVTLIASQDELAAELTKTFALPRPFILPAAVGTWLSANQGSTARLMTQAEVLANASVNVQPVEPVHPV